MMFDASHSMPLALVVEDDPELGEIFTQAVQMSGYEVELISDGGEALERLAFIVPNLVILDMQLPHVSGDKILRHIRADERLANVTVILTTANDRLADAQREESDFVLLKPISFRQLQTLAMRVRPTA